MDLHPYLEPCTLPSPKMWYILATSGEHPAIRVGHACIHISGTGQSNGCLYISGGANPSGTFSDTFCLNLDTFSWQKYPAAGFSGRYEHTIFRGQTDQNKFYVFGGADCNGNRNDIQEFDLTNKTWSILEPSGTAPPPRTFHNGACIGDRLIVYGGGERGAEPVSDKNTYVYEIARQCWSVLRLSGDAPKPRHGHLMVAVGNRLYLHGGMSGSSFFDDLHVLDLDRNSWSCVKVKSSVKPSKRAAHGGFVNGTDIFLFGGMNGSGALNDMFTLNTDTMQWTAIDVCGSAPECRLDFATCTLRLQLPASSTGTQLSCVSHSEQTDVSSDIQCSEKGEDSEVSNTSKAAAGDANVIDVTSEFVGSQNIVDASTFDTECSVASDPVPCITHDVLTEQQAEADIGGLREAIAGVHIGDNGETSSVRDAVVGIVLGGMDTGGEIFDDCLVMRLEM